MPARQFPESSQQGFQPLSLPALLLDHLGIVARQRPGLLQVVPARPTDDKRRVIFPRAVRVAHEPFFGYVERTP